MNNTNQGTGISLIGLLGVLFVGLKLTGHIDWSWWWITLPFWFWIPILLIMLAMAAIYWAFFKNGDVLPQ